MEGFDIGVLVNMGIGAVLTIGTWWLKGIKTSLDELGDKLDNHSERIVRNETEIDNIKLHNQNCSSDREALHSRITKKKKD